jgi:hypothetical protein
LKKTLLALALLPLLAACGTSHVSHTHYVPVPVHHVVIHHVIVVPRARICRTVTTRSYKRTVTRTVCR